VAIAQRLADFAAPAREYAANHGIVTVIGGIAN
jgi:hypothetical protein